LPNILMLTAALFACAGVRAQNPLPVTPSAPPPPPGMVPQAQPGVIKRNVDLGVLHTGVVDDRGNFISDLGQDSFRVFEDKVEQKISVLSREDVPNTMGLVGVNMG